MGIAGERESGRAGGRAGRREGGRAGERESGRAQWLESASLNIKRSRAQVLIVLSAHCM